MNAIRMERTTDKQTADYRARRCMNVTDAQQWPVEVEESLTLAVMSAKLEEKRMPSKKDKREVSDPVVELVPLLEQSSDVEAWYLIKVDGEQIAGAISLSVEGKIGLSVMKEFRRTSIARSAVEMLMDQHGPRRYRIDVSRKNEALARLFTRLGFKLVQQTYELAKE